MTRKRSRIPTILSSPSRIKVRKAGPVGLHASRALRNPMPSTQQSALAAVKRTAGKGREGFFTQRRVPGQVNMSMKGYV